MKLLITHQEGKIIMSDLLTTAKKGLQPINPRLLMARCRKTPHPQATRIYQENQQFYNMLEIEEAYREMKNESR